MARKVSNEEPALAITFFTSGFYTFRSELFAPYKAIGVSVVSFHDPVIDGANAENTDKYEWQRRPGFSRYCPTLLPATEIINQFYFFRNLNGTVIDYFDSTARLASFTPTGVVTVVPKTTTAQGYISTLGNMTYFSDGAPRDYAKYDGTNLSSWGLAAPTITPTSTGMGFWYPRAHFSINNPIQDPNGNIEVVSAILIANGSVESPQFFDTLALAGGIGTWGSGAITPGSVESQTLTTIGHTNYLFLHDFHLNIPLTATIVGLQVTVPKRVAGGHAIDQAVNLVVGGAVVGTSQADLVNPWSTGAFTTTSYGGPTNTWGGALPTPTQANTNGLSGFGIGIAANVTSTTNFSLVQAKTANSVVSSSTVCTFSNPVTAGNTLVVGVHVFDQVFVSITDNHGQSYAQAVTEQFGQHSLTTFIVSGTVAGVTSITVTTSGANFNRFVAINAHEFRGILTPSPVAATGSNNSLPSSFSAPFNSGTAAVTNADDLVFSYVIGTPSTTSTPAGGYTAATTNSFFDSPGGFPVLDVAAFKAPGVIGPVSPSWNQGSAGNTVVLKSAESATVFVGGGLPNAPVLTVYYTLPAGTGPGFTGPTEPIWPTIGSIVNDGGVQWTNYGPVEIWFPQTNYSVPVVVLDTNGNLQLAITAANPVQPWNVATAYTTGQIVSFGGGFWISVLAGPNTGVAPSSNYTVLVGGTTTTPYWAPASNPAVTGAIAPVWNTTIGGFTQDGSYTWTNLGQGSPLASFGHAYVYGFRTVYGHLTTSSPFSNNTGAILGPLNGSIQSFSITANVATFNGSNNFIPGNIFTVEGLTNGTDLNNQIFTILTASSSSSFPVTATQISGGNLLTVTALNRLNPAGGQSVTFSNMTDVSAQYLNGLTLLVLPGATGTTFTATFTHANYGPTATMGTVLVDGSWTAAFVHPDVGLTEDSGTAAPLISTITGQGTALLDSQGFALCNSIATITAFSVTANVITIFASNNFQPGIWVTLSGMGVATFLNGQQFQVVAVDQPVGTQNTWFQIFFITPDSVQTPDTGTATFNAVEIYRTSDGGGTYLFDGAVTNPGAQMQWTFDDFVIDDNLDILLIAPLFHQNDPPPGAFGSSIKALGKPVGTISAYWQGRLWIVDGNFVYFDSGPDCTNGIPEEAWAPGNRFQFAGPVLNLQPTADGIGLLVFLADRVAAILGGPDTISFYATDFLGNFGVSNPNAVFRDGSVIGLFTTQKQYFELLGAQKDQIGEHIADYLATNFDAAKSYVTMHRDGTDVGLFISNGIDQILRYGPNVPSWSVPAFPAFGAGALRSIETSVGIYSLMLATPNGGIAPSNPQLGVAATYAILAWSGITNTGNTVITGGNIGSSPTASITGFPPGVVLPPGTIDNTNAAAAHTAAAAAYAHYAGLAFTALSSDDMSTSGIAGGATYNAGNYSGGALDIPTTITLDAQGNSNAVFIFKAASTLTLHSGQAVLLINGAQAKNVIWVVGSSFTSVATSTMVGTILAQISITLGGGTFTGVALAGLGGSSGAVTIAAAEIISTGNTQAQLDQGNYIYARDLNSWGDGNTSLGANDGISYANCFITIGSITLSQLGGRLFPLQHVVGYFDAVGTLNHGGPSYPDIWVLPNEVKPTTEVPFVYLPEIIQEPPVGQNHASSSILALRWNVNMVNSFQMSQFIHHMQCKIQFEPENSPNTIKALAFGEDQSV
jgi:hypothetical protein